MFACVGAMSPGVSIKTDSIETAALLDWDIPDEELKARLEHSYGLIRASLPKKVQAGLG